MANLFEKVINGKTYLVDEKGSIWYVKEESNKDTEEVNEFTLELNIKTNGKTFDCWLSDNIGGSGISIKKTNKRQFMKALADYIEDYLNNN